MTSYYENLPALVKESMTSESIKVLKKQFSPNLFEKALEGGLGAVPIVGGLLSAAASASLTYRDAEFARKFLTFLYGIKETSEEERKAFLEKIEVYAKDYAGNVFVNIIDRFDNINKTEILAKLTIATISGNLTILDYLRILSALEKIPYVDVERLSTYKIDTYESGISELLNSTGLIYSSYCDYVSYKYKLSRLGWLLLKYGLEFPVDIPDGYPVTFPRAIVAEDVGEAIEDSLSFESI